MMKLKRFYTPQEAAVFLSGKTGQTLSESEVFDCISDFLVSHHFELMNKPLCIGVVIRTGTEITIRKNQFDQPGRTLVTPGPTELFVAQSALGIFVHQMKIGGEAAPCQMTDRVTQGSFLPKVATSIQDVRLPGELVENLIPSCGRLLTEDAPEAGQGAPVAEAAQVAPVVETKEQRQDRRLKACEDAGLVMPASELGRLPDGVTEIGLRDGASRQVFTRDVKAAIGRRAALTKPGRLVHRT